MTESLNSNGHNRMPIYCGRNCDHLIWSSVTCDSGICMDTANDICKVAWWGGLDHIGQRPLASRAHGRDLEEVGDSIGKRSGGISENIANSGKKGLAARTGTNINLVVGDRCATVVCRGCPCERDLGVARCGGGYCGCRRYGGGRSRGCEYETGRQYYDGEKGNP